MNVQQIMEDVMSMQSAQIFQEVFRVYANQNMQELVFLVLVTISISIFILFIYLFFTKR